MWSSLCGTAVAARVQLARCYALYQANLESDIAASGFYATSYQSMYTMAQCEGDLSTSDCGKCITQAVQKSEVECGGASSDQVYLDKCYISYSYYTNDISRDGLGRESYSIGYSRVSKIQIPTNPRIAPSLVLGMAKTEKETTATSAAMKPAYISVSVPQLNNKVSSHADAGAMPKGTLPPPLQHYVFRTFDRCMNDAQRDLNQDILKEV